MAFEHERPVLPKLAWNEISEQLSRRVEALAQRLSHLWTYGVVDRRQRSKKRGHVDVYRRRAVTTKVGLPARSLLLQLLLEDGELGGRSLAQRRCRESGRVAVTPGEVARHAHRETASTR